MKNPDPLKHMHAAQKAVRTLADSNLNLAPDSWQSYPHLREVEKLINEAIDCYLQLGKYKAA